MKIPWLLVLFFSTNSIKGQDCNLIFKHAIASMCKKDTQQYLRYLIRYTEDCKDSGNLTLAYFFQSLVSEERMRYEESIALLKKALEYYEKPIPLQNINSRCDWALNTFPPPYIISKYTICRNLANIYIKKSNYNQAVFYLDRIDKEKIPGYSGCVNGMIAIETSIALLYSECYLGVGDTSSAIKALAGYCIFNEGEESTKLLIQLKKLLDHQYSKAEIIAELDQSIFNAKEIRTIYENGVMGKSVDFVLFGRKVPFLFFSLEEFSRFVKNNQNLAFLKT